MHFDDLLSVVNDAQLNSALNAYKEITQLMKQASEQRKQNVGEKLTVCVFCTAEQLPRFLFNNRD
jgi:hypothetical protein